MAECCVNMFCRLLSLVLNEYVSAHLDDERYTTTLHILAAMRAFKAIKIFKTVHAIRGQLLTKLLQIYKIVIIRYQYLVDMAGGYGRIC